MQASSWQCSKCTSNLKVQATKLLNFLQFNHKNENQIALSNASVRLLCFQYQLNRSSEQTSGMILTATQIRLWAKLC